MTELEKYYIDNLITEALTVLSDEIEGQQVINLNDLNLCAIDYATTDVIPDYNTSLNDADILKELYNNPEIIKLIYGDVSTILNIDDNKIDDNKDNSTNHTTYNYGDNIIIEFSDATLKDPNPVSYTISVNPGDNISNNTIIGTIKQEGIYKNIKSIFKSGTVLGINNNTEFKRLYSSTCDRHIILENAIFSDGNEFNLSDSILDINEKFKNEAYLYQLITNNMCQSLLPYVLSHRYRGVYTRTYYPFYNYYSKWYLDSSDISYDNLNIKTVKDNEYKNNIKYDTSLFIYDIYNDSLNSGVVIFDSSILSKVDELQNEFGAGIINSDIKPDNMKSWKKRAKKSRLRPTVKKEISEKVQSQTDKLKTSSDPYNAINNEGNRLLDVRKKYVNSLIELYNNKHNLPLCKYDENYADCKYLTNDSIDDDILNETTSINEDFLYGSLEEKLYNYYFNLLSDINLLTEEDNKYINEYYQLISDIINKRLIVEDISYIDLMELFMQLFNKYIKPIFNISDRHSLNSKNNILTEFNSFQYKVNVYVKNMQLAYSNNIKTLFAELDEDAIANAGNLYTGNNEYQKIYDYIRSLCENFEESSDENNTVQLLATMYTYIKSYGTGSNNPYKDLNIDNKYIYLQLVLEESKKITEFWDKVIKIYLDSTLDNCIDDLNKLANSFDNYATWPEPSEITIDNITYKHYLFENIYKRNKKDVSIDIGNYSFPDNIEFPEIPDSIDVDENWALDELRKHELLEEEYPEISFLDFEYWLKYFALATLICLVPTYWNCGLDIPPFLWYIPFPCIFIAIKSIHISMFNMVIVFGIAIRGIYPWPIILYLNASDQPISILTPLVAVLDLLKQKFNKVINQIEVNSLKKVTDNYIDKLNKEINDIRKENIKLDNFEKAIKAVKVPKVTSILEQFAKIVDPSINLHQRIIRIDELAKKSKAK